MGRRVLIVGVASGLGAALMESKDFGEIGDTTVGAVRSDMDITQPGQVQSFINAWGPFTHVVVTAGVYGPLNKLEDTDARKWEYAILDNLVGPVNVCRAVLPAMKEKGYGKIVLLSGGGATKPMPGASAYAASKAGLVRFTETLAHEVFDDGIDVNIVAPGIMPTSFTKKAIKVGPNIIGKDVYNESVAAEIAGVTSQEAFEAPTKLIKFLLSTSSDRISGKLLSAVWDKNWDHIPRGLGDLYTLRRNT